MVVEGFFGGFDAFEGGVAERAALFAGVGGFPAANAAREFRRIHDAYRVPSSVPILKQMGDQLRLSALSARLEKLAEQMETSVCDTPEA